MKEKQTILIADDSEMNRAILAEMLGDSYTIIEAETGRQAIEVLQRQADINLVLLDIMMPEMNGFDVLTTMNKYHWIDEIPVIMISAESALTYVERAYDLGATDYISRPFDMTVVRRRVINTLLLYAKQKRLASLVADQIYEKERSNQLMIDILSHIVEFRNGESGMHVLHIHAITELLLRQLAQKTKRYRLSEEDITLISTASALHDIGKINIPETILNKPGRLTPEEFEVMKTHTTIGADILKELPVKQEVPLLQTAYQICRWHHERYNGKGYPDGLKGDDIPIAAQVVSLADVYDALTSERCYKKAFDHETAMKMILHGECGAFNPLLLDCLIEVGDALCGDPPAGSDTQNHLSDAMQLSERLLNSDRPTYQDHMLHVLRAEQTKSAFFQSLQETVQFDYDAITRTLTLSDWGAAHTRGEKSVYMPEGSSSFLDKADSDRLWDAIRTTTPESPDIQMTAMFPVDGEYRWHRISARSLWSLGNPPERVGVVGQALDIHDKVLQRLTVPDDSGCGTDQDLLTLMQSLQRVFSVVRLVDVENSRIMVPDSEGRLVREDCPCYSVWGQNSRCRDCVSVRALRDKTQLSKLEFTEQGVYQVIAKYLEVAGAPCVLEMINHLEHDPTAQAAGQMRPRLHPHAYSYALYRDALTGAFNRYYYEQQLPQLEGIEAVAMIDADRFKLLNDSFGHQAGDEALRTIVHTILARIRQQDILIRYGGDEFLLLMTKISPAVFVARLEDLCCAVEQATVPGHPQIHLSISVGGIYGASPLSEAIRISDRLMYQAKQTGRHVVVQTEYTNDKED